MDPSLTNSAACRHVSLLLVLAVVFSFAASCRPRPPAPRLVVLYAACTVRSDLLSPYDPTLPYTPALAEFAREAAVFTKHRTEAGQSGVAYASIFSGLQAPGHGIFRHPKRIDESVQLISETFGAEGYDIFFWYTKGNTSPELNYAQGVLPQNVRNAHLQADDPLFLTVLSRLKEDPTFKALIIYAGSVSHAPYAEENLDRFCRTYAEQCASIEHISPESRHALLDLFAQQTQALQFNFERTVERLGLAADEVRDLTVLLDTTYRSRLQVLDDVFGGVVAALKKADLLDSALVAFTADHGEYLSGPQTPFKWEHGWILPRATLDVPWIVRAPTLVPAQRIARVTRSTDVLPTLAGLAGLSPIDSEEDDDLAGVDLSPMLRSADPIPELLAFSHGAMVPDFYYDGDRASSFGPLWKLFPEPSPEYLWVTVRTQDDTFKLVRTDGAWHMEAFDLERDPNELHNVYDARLAEHAKMKDLLGRYKQRLTEGYRALRESQEGGAYEDIPDEKKLEILRSLGYIQ